MLYISRSIVIELVQNSLSCWEEDEHNMGILKIMLSKHLFLSGIPINDFNLDDFNRHGIQHKGELILFFIPCCCN